MRYYLQPGHYRAYFPGSPLLQPDTYTIEELISRSEAAWSLKYKVFKAAFDLLCGFAGVFLIALAAIVLFFLNPLLNPGPVFFVQDRTGRFGVPFRMWKFRTMLPAGILVRGPNDPLELDRITPLGRFLRRTRIDELPNFINVLRGEMSVVGPRPEAATHAEHFGLQILGYTQRHRLRPGITGLAQVEQGYAEGDTAAALKVKYDNLYVTRSCGRMDIYIIVKTVAVILFGKGAK
jgi:lipopolysaccharide/colanic/teichoic acid biosynthesis glycosyltransferase